MKRDGKPFKKVAFLVVGEVAVPSSVITGKVAEEFETFSAKSAVGINADWTQCDIAA